MSDGVARTREIPKIAHGRVRSCSSGKGALLCKPRAVSNFEAYGNIQTCF